ncbi:MAG: proline racemase family protein [Defluviitaleaceae bacterium]|nr:proline racemase family protein [Defluviitaleaceae bacterium]
MKIAKMINAIDTHTMGEPTRIVTGGIPSLKGSTMAEKKEYLIDKMDYIRTALMHEPRGHRDMFGAIITQPASTWADLGVIFMDGGGYLNMCGHGTIGAVTAALETGMIEPVEPITQVTLDTPAGLVTARATVEDRRVGEVSFANVPSFLYKRDVEIDMPQLGKLTIDIAFGGSFFALVKATDLGLDIIPENAPALSKMGLKIRAAVNGQVPIAHPLLTRITTCDLVEIYSDPIGQGATARNVVIFGDGQVDRSPCGTGTCAKLAALHAKGQIKEGEVFVYESILGTQFKGKIISTETVGDFDAVIPEITASAYITGLNTYVIDDRDPLKHGFIL